MKKILIIRQFLVMPITAFVFLLSANIANACSCNVSPPVNIAFQQTPNVVVLKVQSVEKYQEGEKGAELSTIKQSKLLVEKVFKGNLKVGQELTFAQGVCCICVWAFSEESVGSKFLFYLPEKPNENGVWQGSICSRSGSIKNKAADLLYLEKIEKVRGKTRLSGTINQDVRYSAEETDSSYKPLAGKSVRVVGMGKDTTVETDEDGVYEIYGLPAGKYKIIPEKVRGYKFWNESSFREVELKAGNHSEADFTFIIDNNISGKFLDSTGKPLKNVCLNLLSAIGKKLPFNYKVDCTDVKGNFQIEEIPAGTYVIVVNDDGKITAEEPFGTFYYPNTSRIEDAAKITIGAGDFFNDLVITAPTTAETITISGIVTFEKGTVPIKENYEYVSVYFVPDESDSKPVDGKRDNNSRAEVDENGRFTIRILKDQRGKLHAELMSYVGEYQNCPKLDNLLRSQGERFGITVKTNSVEVEAINEMSGVELSFPFPSCKKAKIQ